MKTPIKVAIYSGEIPSTTFIERLIVGLSKKPCEIYVFGVRQMNVDYHSSVSVFAYKSTQIRKALYLLKYSLLLLLFKNKDKQNLDAILKHQSKNLLLDKLKCYPVLWHKPDIFHLQWAKGVNDWIWVKQFGIKLVLSLRGAHINYSPIADDTLAAMYRKNFRKVDAFHAVSEAIGKEAVKYGAPKEKITVVYSGLPVSENENEIEFENEIAPMPMNDQNHKAFQIISVGRPHWKKGYTYALDACKILKDHGFKFHYTIVGGANDIEFAYQILDLKLTNDVTLLDTMAYNQVQGIIYNSDLLVLPSVEEGIANVVLEAMSLKSLVLSTNCGGMKEVIRDRENGFIVPKRNSECMANKIMEIAQLPDLEKELIRQNALHTIKNKHTEQQMVDAMIAVYQSI